MMHSHLTPNGRRFLEAAGLTLEQIDLIPERGWFDDLASPRVGLISEIPRSQRMREFGIEALHNLTRNGTGRVSAQGLQIPNEAFIMRQVRAYGDEFERRTISAEPYWKSGTIAAINRAGDDLADMLAHGRYRIAPPLGRPPLPVGEARTARAEWRTTDSLKSQAQALAERRGVPLSVLLDELVRSAGE